MERYWRDQTKALLQPFPRLQKLKPKIGQPILRNYRQKLTDDFYLGLASKYARNGHHMSA